MSQPDFLYELFEDFMDDPANQDFSMDNGLVCRWMTGQAKICLLYTSEQALTAAMNEYNNAGTVFEPTEITVADYLNQWFDLYCKTNLKYNTQVGYLRIIQGHLIPKFGMYRLKAITPAVLQEYAVELKMNGNSKSHLVGILSVFSAAPVSYTHLDVYKRQDLVSADVTSTSSSSIVTLI